MAGDCVRFDRPGSTGGSTDVSIQGVRSTSCKGYGLNVTVPEIVEHLQVSNSNFRLNNAGAFSGIAQTNGREAWNVTPAIDVPVDDLATAENGTVLYCPDCLQSDPCRKGGTGALAKRVRGAWSCK
jgi:hypothetical protein